MVSGYDSADMSTVMGKGSFILKICFAFVPRKYNRVWCSYVTGLGQLLLLGMQVFDKFEFFLIDILRHT